MSKIKTATAVASTIGTFYKSNKSPEDLVKSYAKPNSYNNMLVAMNHHCDFVGQPRLALKAKRRSPDALIIAPKKSIEICSAGLLLWVKIMSERGCCNQNLGRRRNGSVKSFGRQTEERTVKIDCQRIVSRQH
jgi:hypothetical protein